MCSSDQSFDVKVNHGEPGDPSTGVYASAVLDTQTSTIVVKLVNTTPDAWTTRIELPEGHPPKALATVYLLTGNPTNSNPKDPMSRGREADARMTPKKSSLKVAPEFEYEAPTHSLSVIRVRMAE
jgi:alpha-L-arabinofuranosidase